MNTAAALLAAVSVFGLAAACLGLTPAEQREVAHNAATIAHCQDIGRACKADGGSNCYAQYDACMKDGGL